MLERIREGATGIFAKTILGLVILSFVFAGVGGYLSSNTDIAAATVNGEEIPNLTLERAYQNERARMESQLGEAFAQLAANPTYMSSFRDNILDKLVSDKLLDQMATELGMRVSDEQVKEAIFSIPAFQVDGRFNNDRFQTLIRQSGFKVTDFRDNLRTELTRQQLTQAILASDFALDSEAKESLRLQRQTRDARYVTVPVSAFNKDISVSEEERQTYYNSHLDMFETKEKVKVEYITLSVDDLLDSVEVSDEEVAESYDANLASYRADEQRRASHILIEFGEDEAAALGDAQGLLDIARTGADFAILARDNSADTFSAENGGDLDWFGKGGMDPAFEEATFALENVGDLSDVVKSEFGYHIIKLTDIKAEQVQPLEEVKEEIMAEVRREKAAELYFDYQSQMNELAFEVADSLEDVAAIANLEAKQSDFFSRDTAPVALSNAAVIETIFAADFIADGVNSDAIELSNNNMVFVRVADYQPERIQTIDEVTEQINAAVTEEKAIEAAVAWANELETIVNENSDVETKLGEFDLTWEERKDVGRYAGNLPSNITTELFKMSMQSPLQVVELNNGNVALVELLAVKQVESFDNSEVKAISQRLAMGYGQDNYTQVIAALKESAEIQIIK